MQIEHTFAQTADDLLDQAAQITCFLVEALTCPTGQLELSENAKDGLAVVLEAQRAMLETVSADRASKRLQAVK